MKKKGQLCKQSLSCFSLGPSRKKGAVEWTIGRLLSLVLLVAVLALVIYGVSTNGLNPLIEKAQGMIDSVLILFGMNDGEQVIMRECFNSSVSIPGVGDGNWKRIKGCCFGEQGDWRSAHNFSNYRGFEKGALI